MSLSRCGANLLDWSGYGKGLAVYLTMMGRRWLIVQSELLSVLIGMYVVHRQEWDTGVNHIPYTSGGFG